MQQAWLYALADAQRRTGVAVHHGILPITHEHLTATPEKGNLPEFTQLLHQIRSPGFGNRWRTILGLRGKSQGCEETPI